jgi:hypothetical protein
VAMIGTVTGHDLPMVTADEGGGRTSDSLLAGAAGDDSPPSLADSVVVLSTPSGRVIVAVVDNLNEGEAAPGERRLYSRSVLGPPAAVLWLKADGSIALTAPGGVTCAGALAVEGDLDVTGAITATGDITAAEVTAGATPATAVSLSTHTHPAPGGTTSPPTPGT